MYDNLYEGKNRAYYSHSRDEILPFIPPDVKEVLDVGCGDGEFGYLLKRDRQIIVYGIEPDLKSASKASARLDSVLNIYLTEDTVRLIDRKFDVIFFNDVLEHLIEPEKILPLCRNILKDNGIVIASIPNFRHHSVINSIIFDKDFKYQAEGPLDRTHLRFFTKKSIKRLFTNCDMRIKLIQGINLDKPVGRKVRLLRFLLHRFLDDIEVLQYLVIAHFN